MNAWPASRSAPARVAPGVFPPEVIVQVKALACELPATLGVALSHLSTADIAREAQRHGIVASLSGATVWRWLHEDAIRPRQHRTWIFRRDPEFAAKAGRILDLYARCEVQERLVAFQASFPYATKLCLNGHEWLKWQLTRKRLRFEPLDNRIRSCASPARVRALAD